MTRSIDARSKRRLPAKLAVGLAISAFLVLGTFVASASAENWQAQDTFEKNHGQGDRHRGWHGGDRGYHREDRGYYRGDGYYYGAPPVVYGSPYGGSYYGAPYGPPPVIYNPGVYINLW